MGTSGEDAQADGRAFRACCAGCRTFRAAVERARMTEAAEAAQEAAALAESQQLADEIRALHDHIDNLVRGREDPVLVDGLKEELSELENRGSDIKQRIEQQKSHRHQVLENAVRELESAEQQHRQVADLRCVCASISKSRTARISPIPLPARAAGQSLSVSQAPGRLTPCGNSGRGSGCRGGGTDRRPRRAR